MWFLFDAWLVDWVLGFGVFGFLVMVVLGFWGRKVDGYSYCRRCGYCLEGMDGPRRCVECGAGLDDKGSVFVGLRVRKKGCFVWGILWLAVMFGWGNVGLMVEVGDRPVGWLMHDLGEWGAADLGDEKRWGEGFLAWERLGDEEDLVESARLTKWLFDMGVVWDELTERLEDGKLNQETVDEVVGFALKRMSGAHDLRFYSRGYFWSDGNAADLLRDAVRGDGRFLDAVWRKGWLRDEEVVKYCEVSSDYWIGRLGERRVSPSTGGGTGKKGGYEFLIELNGTGEMWHGNFKLGGLKVERSVVGMRIDGKAVLHEILQMRFYGTHGMYWGGYDEKGSGFGEPLMFYVKGDLVRGGEAEVVMEFEMVSRDESSGEVFRWREFARRVMFIVK